MRVRREAARVVVLDPEDATFLFRYDDVEVGRHWAMPGGGIEPGETPDGAALRELIEETGWRDITPGPLLWIWEHDFTRFGVPTRQRDQIYLGRGARRPPSGNLAQAHADDEILEWRWWSMSDLRATKERFWPPQLYDLLGELQRVGPPELPLDLGLSS